MRVLLVSLLIVHAISHGGKHASHSHEKQGLSEKEGAPLPLVSGQFPLSAVRLEKGSRMAAQQARNMVYLTTLDSVRLACLYTSAANITGTWEKPTCDAYDHPQYWGHYLGHWLSASALSIQNGADAEGALTTKVTAMVSTLASVQDAWGAKNQIGLLIPYDPFVFYELLNGNNCAPLCVPFYVYHKMLAGMLDLYTRVNIPQALEVAKGMGDWVVAFQSTVFAQPGGAAAWQVLLGTEWGGMNDGLQNLYRATGDAKYQTAAYVFNHYAWTSPLIDRVDDLEQFHANTHIPEIIGDANGYELTGNETQRLIVQNFLDILYANHSYATGGSNDFEYWHPSRTLGDSMNSQTEETCTQYNILKTNVHRFSWDANVMYMDMYARQLYGGMIGNQAITGEWEGTNSTGFHYMLPLGGAGLQKPWGDSASGFPCCWGTSSEAFAGRHIENIFHEQLGGGVGGGVFVQLFEPAILTWPKNGVVLTQTAGFPASTVYTTRITINNAGRSPTVPFSINIRVPAWATTGGNKGSLNGNPIPSTAMAPGTYLNLTRVWAMGDTLEVYFPAALRWEQLTDDRPEWQGVGALIYGDYLLAGVNTTTQYLGGADVTNLTSWVQRVPSEETLAFEITATDGVCGGSNAITIPVIPLANVVFESYTVYFHAVDSPVISYNGSSVTALPSGASAWRTLGAASVLGNGATENIRSGDPQEINAAYLSNGGIVKDALHSIASVSFSYQYVSGYGPAGAHIGTNFTALFLDACSAGINVSPPSPASIKAFLYESPELTQYPFDVCNTCYSPLQNVSFSFPPGQPLNYDNYRNVQMNLPLNVTITWA